MRRRRNFRCVFFISALVGMHGYLTAAEQHEGGQVSKGAILNSAGDAWGTSQGDYNALVWDPEPNASQYAVSRSDSSRKVFREIFRTSLTNGVDLIRAVQGPSYCYRIEAVDGSGNPFRAYSPVCLLRNESPKVGGEESIGPEALVGCAPPYSTINSMCLSDEEFVALPLSEADIEAFLAAHGSFLRGNIKDVDGARINPAHLIVSAAQASVINAQVLLATLEKESSAISLKTRPNDIRLRTIMGYNPDYCVRPTHFCSIREQIADAAAQFRRDINRLSTGHPAPGNPPWQVGLTTQSADPLPVTPTKKAVATLFSYTEWVGQAWCGRRGVGGNALFCQVWSAFNFSSPPPVDLSVSLVASPNQGAAPLTGVTLIAYVTGDPNESINYTFYCNRADAGTDIKPGWIGKYDGVLRHRVTLTGVCNYPSDAVYTAKVIVEQGNGAAESRMPIKVGSTSACFPLTLTVNNPGGGNVPSASPAESSGCAPGQYVGGESIQLTAAPAIGWSVGSWTGTQNDSSTSTTNSLLMPAASQAVTVNYVQSAPSPLTILTTSLPNALPNQHYSVELAASGGTGTGYSWSLQGGLLPLGLSLNAQTGAISGTSTQADTLSNFTISVRDSGANSTSRRFSLYVQPVAGPTIVSSGPSDFVFYVGTPYARANSITYLVQSGQPPFDWSASGLPPGLQIDTAGGFLYGTPTTPGSFPGRISASDSIGEHASLPIVLQVSTTSLIFTDSSGHTPPNPPPAQLGQSYHFFIEAAGGSQTGFQWSVQGNLPPGLVSQNGPGCPTYCALEIVGTPTLAGTYRFTVTVTDSLNNHASLTVTIIVNSGIPPMITTSQLPTATIGSAYSTGLSATGGTPPYRWSFSGSSPDPGIQLSQDGTLSGITQNTNDCPTGSSDHLGGIWVGQGYPSIYFQVLVTDAIGQSNSKQLCLVSYYPRPQVSSNTPSSIMIDGQNHTITLNGSNFRSTSYIIMNGGALPPTTYIGPNALSFTFYPKNTAAFCADQNGIGSACVDAGNVMQSVIEPYSNISSTSTSLAIYNPPPTVTSVAAVLDNTNQPCTANQLCQLIVNGSGFSFHSDTSFLITEENLNLSAAVVPSSPPPWNQIITSAFFLPSGTYTLQVTNNHQAGGSNVSVSASFQVN